MLSVHFRVFCPAKNEIYGHVVEVSQAYQGLGGDVALSGFVVTISALTAENRIRHLGLGQKFAFS